MNNHHRKPRKNRNQSYFEQAQKGPKVENNTASKKKKMSNEDQVLKSSEKNPKIPEKVPNRRIQKSHTSVTDP